MSEGATRGPGFSDPDLSEILAALELPPDGIKKWLAHDRAFCDAHGGARVYGELLALFAECESALERRSPERRSPGSAS